MDQLSDEVKNILKHIEAMCLNHRVYCGTHPEVWIPVELFKTLKSSSTSGKQIAGYYFSTFSEPIKFKGYAGLYVQVLPDGSHEKHVTNWAIHKLEKMYEIKDKLHPLTMLIVVGLVEKQNKVLSVHDINFINEVYPEYFKE